MQLWHDLGLDPAALRRLTITGHDPVLPSAFAIGQAAATSIGLAALAATLYAGRPQPVGVALRDAAAEFRSERYLRIDGAAPEDPWDAIAGLYPCADGFLRLHTNFAHHRAGVIRLLGCADNREAVAEALRGWKALDFEAAATAAGMVVAALRSYAEWDPTPQAQAIAAEPLIALRRIGDAPPVAAPRGARLLAGLRVLDLTRIIAGPVTGRVLAAHGADVLRISGPGLPQIPSLVVDTGRGKRSAELALDDPRLLALADGADVFLQSFRPGALAAHGFGAAALAARRTRRGIVHASLSAYGFEGPWASRRGFDSLVQTTGGINRAEAEAAGRPTPQALPAQALDHGAGTLLALGILAALIRRQQEGGSWEVRVSLARTAYWLRSLGPVADGFSAADPGPAEIADRLEDSPSAFGRLTAVKHAATLPDTPAAWTLPATPFGHDAPGWVEG
jgi:crotonobetainyl-CoA:carnitine CoA-transferase CaiB-like acyl-CoA transferase